MVKQLELDYAKPEHRTLAGPKLACRMIAYLNVSPGWTTRTHFKDSIGLTDRECRLGRKNSHGRIIFGQKGYRLTKDATQKEISECLATIISQIKELQLDYEQISKVAHEGLH